MPFWMHVFSPLAMTVYIIICLFLNFAVLCLASVCSERLIKARRFAARNIVLTFLLGMLSKAAGYAVLIYNSTSNVDAASGLMRADYGDFGIFLIPLASCAVSFTVMYLLTRFILIRTEGYSKVVRTLLCIAFSVVNTPLITLIPVL